MDKYSRQFLRIEIRKSVHNQFDYYNSYSSYIHRMGEFVKSLHAKTLELSDQFATVIETVRMRAVDLRSYFTIFIIIHSTRSN